MVWKQGERVIYADTLHVGIELRASIVDETSLLLRGVDTQYTGKLRPKKMDIGALASFVECVIL